MPLSRARQWWIAGQRKLRDGVADAREDMHRALPYWRFGGVILLLYVLIALVLGIYWSRIPAPFDVRANAIERLGDREPVPGSTLLTTVMRLGETLVDKPGGYLSNDLTPPGLWLDNMPSWERGVLLQLRAVTTVLRDDFSRPAEALAGDKDMALAQSRFHFSHRSWVIPSSESQYRDGVVLTGKYLDRLLSEQSSTYFGAGLAHLDTWLEQVEQALDYHIHHLNASVGPVSVLMDGEQGELPRTPWRQLDNVFFEARGSVWALLHVLRAVERDLAFASQWEDPQARSALQTLIRDLEASQRPLRSPVILNGSGFGLLANHSLVMSTYLSRAHTTLALLRERLAAPQGMYEHL